MKKIDKYISEKLHIDKNVSANNLTTIVKRFCEQNFPADKYEVNFNSPNNKKHYCTITIKTNISNPKEYIIKLNRRMLAFGYTEQKCVLKYTDNKETILSVEKDEDTW